MKTILQLCAVAMFTFVSINVAAQERSVSGRITSSEDGLPIPGVNVILKGSSDGTVTDIGGNYKMVVQDGSTLVFSFIGFETIERQVGANSVLDISLLPDTKQLSEVVITAIGLEANKRELGYSIQNIDASEIQNSNETNLVSALSGKAAGVQVVSSSGTPGASAQIRIRGNKSVAGSNSPLFVVDGFAYDADELVYPIPDREMNVNDLLVQNDGYFTN
jgi:hypothetical protein